jgi:hypothetical protein
MLDAVAVAAESLVKEEGVGNQVVHAVVVYCACNTESKPCAGKISPA